MDLRSPAHPGDELTPKPGRDERGRFLTNDAAVGQAVELLAEAVDYLMGCVLTAEPPIVNKPQLERFNDLLDAAREAAALADAGERPATEET